MSQNYWWFKKPNSSKDLTELSKAYNEKYGDGMSGANNERFFDNSFNEKFTEIIHSFNFDSVFVVGANSGMEIDFIKSKNPLVSITAIDVSNVALGKLHKQYSDVRIIHGDIESYKDNQKYDLYVCCRTIHSSSIQNRVAVLKNAMKSSNNIVLSISNAYIKDGDLVHGMFDYDKNEIDLDLPYSIRFSLKKILNDHDYDTTYDECSSELFIIAKKSLSVERPIRSGLLSKLFN